jgi:hypothetical protein
MTISGTRMSEALADTRNDLDDESGLAIAARQWWSPP